MTIFYSFVSKDHEDRCPSFHGKGDVLAHAFFPQYGGDVHFDYEEVWTLYTGRLKNYGSYFITKILHTTVGYCSIFFLNMQHMQFAKLNSFCCLPKETKKRICSMSLLTNSVTHWDSVILIIHQL